MKIKTLHKTSSQFLYAATLLTLTSFSHASLYNFSENSPSGNHNAGALTSIQTSYDTQTRDFAWNHTVADVTPSQASDGFWLVVSSGPNPKTHAGEYAIFYGDAANNKVTAYEYSGQNNAESWQNPGNHLGSWQMDVTRNAADNASTFAFGLDATALNSSYTGACTEANGECDNNGTTWTESLWQGVAFGEQLGYWMHPFVGSQFSYDAENNITSFQFEQQGWYDHGNRTTTAISEPTSLSLLALALGFGLALKRR